MSVGGGSATMRALLAAAPIRRLVGRRVRGRVGVQEAGTKPSFRRHGAAYQGTLEAVLAIPIALGIGYLVDRRFETFPTFLLVGVVLGFSAFVLRLWRLGRELQQSAGEGSGPRNEE